MAIFVNYFFEFNYHCSYNRDRKFFLKLLLLALLNRSFHGDSLDIDEFDDREIITENSFPRFNMGKIDLTCSSPNGFSVLTKLTRVWTVWTGWSGLDGLDIGECCKKRNVVRQLARSVQFLAITHLHCINSISSSYV